MDACGRRYFHCSWNSANAKNNTRPTKRVPVLQENGLRVTSCCFRRNAAAPYQGFCKTTRIASNRLMGMPSRLVAVNRGTGTCKIRRN